ncbi:TetR/AcrR family transcriptional regulator [Paenibacillus sp. YPG26]|uniref:TetR/AcrR family transcriptional regulator n=1 Tax=Paenibacillus sp. YPG26 TaxID=2878915 RepID=UPI00203DCA49|nr:TetR/AcrR family transcriptional regulator [Paenibacillus sp. YPG26]USB34978.1 TetR/AcrR family transcriptional regulator [Paenibacillus sp. YPG26]
MHVAVDRRQQIVDAAAKSFALFGYKATTMEQVAKIASVGKGTIYTFFANKEQLFDEILRSVLREMKRIIAQEIQAGRPFVDNMQRSLDALLDFRDQHELLIKLSQEVRDFGTPQAKEAMHRVEQVILEHLEGQIVRAMEQNAIRRMDPKIISFVMLELYIALTSEWSKNHDPLDKEQIKQVSRILLAEGLSVK